MKAGALIPSGKSVFMNNLCRYITISLQEIPGRHEK
jgi:hypothetical protein